MTTTTPTRLRWLATVSFSEQDAAAPKGFYYESREAACRRWRLAEIHKEVELLAAAVHQHPAVAVLSSILWIPVIDFDAVVYWADWVRDGRPAVSVYEEQIPRLHEQAEALYKAFKDTAGGATDHWLSLSPTIRRYCDRLSGLVPDASFAPAVSAAKNEQRKFNEAEKAASAAWHEAVKALREAEQLLREAKKGLWIDAVFSAESVEAGLLSQWEQAMAAQANSSDDWGGVRKARWNTWEAYRRTGRLDLTEYEQAERRWVSMRQAVDRAYGHLAA